MPVVMWLWACPLSCGCGHARCQVVVGMPVVRWFWACLLSCSCGHARYHVVVGMPIVRWLWACPLSCGCGHARCQVVMGMSVVRWLWACPLSCGCGHARYQASAHAGHWWYRTRLLVIPGYLKVPEVRSICNSTLGVEVEQRVLDYLAERWSIGASMPLCFERN